MERRLAALVLVIAGVWVLWGVGVALVVAGIGVAWSGLPVPNWPGVRTKVRSWSWGSVRRMVAAGLVLAAAVAAAVGLGLRYGPWMALVSVAAFAVVFGTVLGWE